MKQNQQNQPQRLTREKNGQRRSISEQKRKATRKKRRYETIKSYKVESKGKKEKLDRNKSNGFTGQRGAYNQEKNEGKQGRITRQ